MKTHHSPDVTCPNCGGHEYTEHLIHDGRSIRRDCASCLMYAYESKAKQWKKWHPFIEFSKWEPKEDPAAVVKIWWKSTEKPHGQKRL